MVKEESALKFFDPQLMSYKKIDSFYKKMLILISILICDNYFHMASVFRSSTV